MANTKTATISKWKFSFLQYLGTFSTSYILEYIVKRTVLALIISAISALIIYLFWTEENTMLIVYTVFTITTMYMVVISPYLVYSSIAAQCHGVSFVVWHEKYKYALSNQALLVKASGLTKVVYPGVDNELLRNLKAKDLNELIRQFSYSLTKHSTEEEIQLANTYMKIFMRLSGEEMCRDEHNEYHAKMFGLYKKFIQALQKAKEVNEDVQKDLDNLLEEISDYGTSLHNAEMVEIKNQHEELMSRIGR